MLFNILEHPSDIPVLPGNKDLGWLTNPQYNGCNGEIGIAAANASGLLSNQINQAIEDGLAALIKNRDVRIQDSLFTNRQTLIQTSHQSAQAQIKAKVMGLHMKNRRVYAWIVEQTLNKSTKGEIK